jgi:NAD kinase
VETVFKSVGLVARYDKKQALKLAEELAEYLRSKNVKVYVEDTLAGKVNVQEKAISLTKMKTDFIITIGGDGTANISHQHGCSRVPHRGAAERSARRRGKMPKGRVQD